MTEENDPFFKSKGGVANWLRTNLSKERWQGTSGKKLLGELRNEGVSIATSKFYEVRRQVLSLQKYEEQIQTLSDDRPVPASWINTEHGLNLSNRFLYRFEVRVEALDSGDEFYENRSMAYSSQDDIGFIKELFRSLYADAFEKSGFMIKEISLTGVLAQPDIFG
jgi:hypothetical protein